MDNQLSVINESVVELSSSISDINSRFSQERNTYDRNEHRKEVSEKTVENYKFFLDFHNSDEKTKKITHENNLNNNYMQLKKTHKKSNKNILMENSPHQNQVSLASKLSIEYNPFKLSKMTATNNKNKYESRAKKDCINLEKDSRRFSQKLTIDKNNLTPTLKQISASSLITYNNINSENKLEFTNRKSSDSQKMTNSYSCEPEGKKLDRSNTFCYKPEKNFFEICKNKQMRKKVLTIDQVVQDINKNVITFSKRRSTSRENFGNTNLISSILNKNEIKKELSEFDDISPTIRRLSENSNLFTLPSNRNNINILNPYFKKKRIQCNFRKLYSVINAISFVLYVKKEIIRYGITPTSIKPMLVYDNDNLLHNREITVSQKTMSLQIYNLKCPWYIILPESLFHRIWEKIFLLILIYFVIFVPYRVSFTNSYLDSQNVSYFYFDIIIEFIFLLDIIFNCLKSFNDNEGNLVISVRKIIYVYMASLGLVVDFLFLFPFIYAGTYFMIKSEVDKTIILLQYFRSIKLYFIVNSTTFAHNMEEKLSMNTGLVKLLVFLINAIFVCHIFSCLFYYSCILNNFDDNTWVYRYFWLDDDKPSLYLRSLYFAFTSFITVGYGDIVPFTSVEIVIVICWLVFSGVFYTSSLTNLSKIFLDYSSNKFLINNKCMIVSEIFKKSKLPIKIEKDTIKFMKLTHSKIKEKISIKDVKSFLSEIPLNLRYQIATEMYEGVVNKINIFSKSSKSFISNIVPLLQSKYILANNYVYHCDEVPQTIYFICEGSIKLQTEDFISFTTLIKGDYFGEIEILRKTYREHNAKAINKCHFLTLNKNIVWDDIMKNHIEFLQHMIENMIKRHNFYERMRDIV